MKFGLLIEYIMRNIFPEKSTSKIITYSMLTQKYDLC